MTTRTGTWIAGAAVALCVAILLADYAMAPKLSTVASAQKRITTARLSRKSRDNTVGWVLIVAASVFLTLAKQNGGRALAGVGLKPRPTESGAKAPRRLKPALQVLLGAQELDISFIDELVAQVGRGKENAITLLQAIQNHYRYLPDEALHRLCELTDITPAQLTGASTFYGQFRNTPVGKHLVRVCHGTACHVAGARQITEELRRYLGIPEGTDTDPARMFTVGEVACLGCCSLAPVLMVDGHTAGRLSPASVSTTLTRVEETENA